MIPNRHKVKCSKKDAVNTIVLTSPMWLLLVFYARKDKQGTACVFHIPRNEAL